MRSLLVSLALLGGLGLAACDDGAAAPDGAAADAAPADAAADAAPAWEWGLPPGTPSPRVPADNPMSAAKVELGRYLFYDKRLSGNQTQACAGCHVQAHAFADGKLTPTGSTGEVLRRNAMHLTNVAFNSAQTWANPTLRALEKQALVPMFGEFPVELGLAGLEDVLLERLAADPRYQTLFAAAFPAEDDPFSVVNVVRAIASFERTLLSFDSPYDRFQAGDGTAMSASALRGMELFFSEELECHHCHGGFNLTTSFESETSPAGGFLHYFNNGLYNVDGAGAYPAVDTGLAEVSTLPADMGRFRAPSLRNIAVTGPYMHDGSVETLDEVVAMYARGGRLIASGPNAGDGATSPHKNAFVSGFVLTPVQQADLVAFLHSLTDQPFLTNPDFADPFPP